MPNQTGLRDIAALGGVDAVHVTDAFSVFGILTVRDIDTVLVDHGRADQLIACLGPDGIFWIRVKFPELLACQRFVTANPAVALCVNELDHAPDRSHCWRRPLAMQNLIEDRIIFPDEFSRLL